MSAVEKEQPEAAKTRFAKDQLKAFVERIERLEEEKKTISDDIRDVYAESKGNGFDVKALRAVIRLRKQEPQRAQRARAHPGNLHERAGDAGGVGSAPIASAHRSSRPGLTRPSMIFSCIARCSSKPRFGCPGQARP